MSKDAPKNQKLISHEEKKSSSSNWLHFQLLQNFPEETYSTYQPKLQNKSVNDQHKMNK